MLLAPVALTVATGDHPDAIVIGLVILVNTTVGVVQEIRAASAVAALSALSAPTARVLPDGEEREVAAAAVVPGDILLLAEGAIVPADVAAAPSGRAGPGAGARHGRSVPGGCSCWRWCAARRPRRWRSPRSALPLQPSPSRCLGRPLMGLALPLRAGQILWISLLTHALVAFAAARVVGRSEREGPVGSGAPGR
ncbi:hypothetical protein [Kitasatospora camelliae]|uniref:P-type ATPase A domain-containing protein n=1 Tax=Kitasatospora camelliae TaxID=3156397 RepID=A0AAU8JMW3_9ACTN